MDGPSRRAIIMNKLGQQAMICCCQGMIINPPASIGAHPRSMAVGRCAGQEMAVGLCFVHICHGFHGDFLMLKPEQKCGCCFATHLKPALLPHCSEYRRLPSIPGGGLMCRALNGCWIAFCLHPLWILRRFVYHDTRAEMVMPLCFPSEPSTPVAL